MPLVACGSGNAPTSVAIENGLGGVMTFAAHCDLPASNEMSLHNAVARACADKLSDAQ